MTNMTSNRYKHKCTAGLTGFTLIELMVVIGIVAVLLALIFPAVTAVKASAQRIYCANNLRHLYLANTMYADDHGYYVAASPGMIGSNNKRWHGSRPDRNKPFDDKNGPLAPYLGQTGIRHCPSFRSARKSTESHAFESGCGGYGYNSLGAGSQTWELGLCKAAMEHGMTPSDIQKPGLTIMFADCAFPQPYGSNPEYLVEYSFAEPFRWVFSPGSSSGFSPDPSIHFRHRGRANVVWCDGHVSSEKMTRSGAKHFKEFNLGWFGPADNSLFTPGKETPDQR